MGYSNRTNLIRLIGRYEPYVAILAVSLVGAGVLAYRWAHATGSIYGPTANFRSSPISICPIPERCIDVSRDQMQKILSQVEPLESGMSLSLYLHGLRVFGPEATYHRGKLSSSRDIFRLFSDQDFSREVLGMPAIVRTPYGIRCTTDPDNTAKESHRDHCLAILSEQGIPASFPIKLGTESFTLRDMLNDSIANFELSQKEIEWTAMTYVMWLPPQREWTNKFGERFTFDQLTDELISRLFSTSTCRGTHLFQALILLARVDGEVAEILSPKVRDKLAARLRITVHQIEFCQDADGSWGPNWFEGLENGRSETSPTKRWSVDDGSLSMRLVTTSHLGEFLLYLPKELRPSTDMIARSGRWLQMQLNAVDADFVRKNFCPCTHGARVVEMLRRIASEAVVGQPRSAVSTVNPR